MGILKKIFMAIGKITEEQSDKYTPQYSGQWKNKGTVHNEDWVWKEKAGTKSMVNVFQLEDDYIITVGNRRRPSAIEAMSCRDEREVEIALELLSTYYGTLGNVVISMEDE